MYSTGSVIGGLPTLLVVVWSAFVQLESLNAGWASGASERNRPGPSAGSDTPGGPGSMPDRAPPLCGVIATGLPFQLTDPISGAARTCSGVGPAALLSGVDQADVAVAPPSCPARGKDADVSPVSASAPPLTAA